MPDEMIVRNWIGTYGRAWEEANADAAVALFTPDATYRSLIFNDAYEGSLGIDSYWRRATGPQSDVSVELGEPLIAGDDVVVEWWTRMTDAEDGDSTLPGVLLLRFSGDRCSSLREYWNEAEGRQEPFPEWGRRVDGDTEKTLKAANEWAKGWERGWRAFDVAAVAALYAPDAVFRTHPFREPEPGRDGVAAYTRWAFADEEDPDPVFGAPVASGSNAAVEWWAPVRENGNDVTLAGCSMLTFDAHGLVAESHDYWQMKNGRHEPPPGWGWR